MPVAVNAVERQLREAQRHFGAGRLDQAAAAYRSVLGRSGRDADVLHVLALIADSSGQGDEAIALTDRALALSTQPAFFDLRGKLLRKAGKAEDAVNSLRQAAALAPNPDRYMALGNAQLDAKAYAAAAESFQAALAIKPDWAEARHNLSVALYRGGEKDAAILQLQQLLAANPASARIASNLGVMLFEQERDAEAETAFAAAIQAAPDQAKPHHDLALTQRRLGRYEDAIASARAAIALDPDYADAHRTLIEAAVLGQRPTEVLPSCLKLIEIKPEDPWTWSRFGFILGEMGRFEDAVTALRKSITLDPEHAEGYFRLIPNLTRCQKPQDALAMACKLVELRPNAANSYSSFAVALSENGHWQEALAMCGKALEIEPDNAFLHYTLARVAWEAGALETALQMVERAIALMPEAVQMQWDRAMVLLRLGRFREGWDAFEVRWGTTQMRPDERTYSQPQWQGEDIAGKTILLYAEQGQGDTIQFVRYAQLVAARGARVVLHVQQPLKRLMQSVEHIAQLVGFADPLPDFDLHCPLMSLPRIFGTEVDTVPAPIPYLHPEADALARWQQHFGPRGARPRVGLIWAGNNRHWNDRNRSIKLARLAPLLAQPDVEWFSFQVGPNEKDLALLPPGQVQDLAPLLTDFAETAAALTQMDLLISVDTSCAHLGGALGVPVWMFVPFTPDWRWMLNREDTPWYPTMRLFRQSAFDDWEGVVARMGDALATLLPAPDATR